jgi:hypothetical protein
MTKRPMTLYTKMIMDHLKVDADTAHEVEDIMRDEYGTLDYISKAEFNRGAKRGLKLLPEIRKIVAEHSKGAK